jgi:hypothetical protein
MSYTTPERMQLAAEVIRFFEERVPPERRSRVAWAVVISDRDEPVGPQPLIVSAFASPEHTAAFLAGAAALADRPGETSIPTPTAPEAS